MRAVHAGIPLRATFERVRVTDFVVFAPAHAIKLTILRPSGSPGEHDVFGAQRYASLSGVAMP